MKILRSVIFLCCMIFLHTQILYSQNNPERDFVLSAQGHYGFIMSHRNSMTHLIKGHIYGGELNYIFRTDGFYPWQQVYKYPDLGICVLHLYLSNPQQLGTLEGLYPYTNIRLNKLNKKVNLNLRLGAGLGFLTKPFDRIKNHKNNTIGTHVNALVNLRLSAKFTLSQAWELTSGVGLTHISNGAVKTPNLGLNMVTVNVGMGYAFGNKCINYKKDSIPTCEQAWKISIVVVSGVKEVEIPGGRKYMAFGLQSMALRTLNLKNKLGGGIEFTYNTATKKEWIKNKVLHPTFDQMLQVGAKVCYAYTFHKLSFPVELGVYVFKKQPLNGSFFNRIGLRYMVTKHVIANITLLSHFAKADYFEGGIGYEF